MQSKIKPLPGYCLIEPIEDEQKSAGGVYLPESSKDKPSKGKVLAIGDVLDMGKGGFLVAPRELKIDEIVVYKKWSNQEVSHEGKEYLLVKFDELLAVIE